VVTGSSGVVIGCGATLTIEPGVVVKFNSTRTIMVGQATYGTGNLVARGIPEAPIIFTSVKDPCDPCNLAAAGDWRQIYFTDYSVDATYDSNDDYLSGSILEYIIVEYAGYGNSGAIFAEKSSPCLNYCEVRHNSYYGIQVDGTNAPNINIGNCEVWDNSQCGIYIANGSGHKLLNNYIHNNRSSGISFNSTGGNILLGNTITGSTVSGSGGGIYFFPSCGSDCGGSNTLSGNTITGNTASDSGGGIYFGGQCGPGYGYSSSNGNTLSENTITDNTAGGSGGGIYFIASSGNTLTGNTITGNIATNGVGGGIYFGYLLCGYCYWNCWEEYHGSNSNALSGNIIQNNTSQNGSIYIDGSSNCTFSHNIITGNHTDAGTTGGIYVTGTSTYYSSTFLTNYSAHISLAGDPNTGTYNIIHSNDGYQIYNDNPFDVDGQYDVNAIYVQWGTSDFGIIEDLIYDWFDDSSKDFVVCWPFVTEILGDFDGDWDVDEADLGTFCNNWLRADCNAPDWCEGADLDLSHEVDFLDFAIFAKHWLEGI
jgi:parallel beta-helix repeat protein